jgi:hypothetical protein
MLLCFGPSETEAEDGQRAGTSRDVLEMSARWGQSPNLLWPEDPAWFMASESKQR